MAQKVPESFIKEVAIEIDPEYDLDNSPISFDKKESDKKIFIGREKNVQKLKTLLRNEKGVYLVTGYRGMGKTSFVNKSINGYISEVEVSEKDNAKKTKIH